MSLAGLTGHLVALTLSFLSGRDCVRVASLCAAFTKLKRIPLNLWGWTDKCIDAIQFHTRRTFVMNLSLANRIGLFPCTRKAQMSAESPRFILGERVELGGADFNPSNFRALLPTLIKVKELLINISQWCACTMGEELICELLNMLPMVPNLRSLCLATDERIVETVVQRGDEFAKSMPKPTRNDISCCLQRLDMRLPFLKSQHMEVMLNACPGLLELDVSSNESVSLTVGL